MLSPPTPRDSRNIFLPTPDYNFTGTIQTTDSVTCALVLSRLANLKRWSRRKKQFLLEPSWL